MSKKPFRSCDLGRLGGSGRKWPDFTLSARQGAFGKALRELQREREREREQRCTRHSACHLAPRLLTFQQKAKKSTSIMHYPAARRLGTHRASSELRNRARK
jgi:hypothetical protein